MKTAIKVLSIIGIAASAISIFSFLVAGCAMSSLGALDPEMQEVAGFMGGMYVFMGFMMIVPLVFSIIGLKKIKTATCKRDLLVIGILTIIFASIPAGILMLCIPESAFDASSGLPPVDDDPMKNYNM